MRHRLAVASRFLKPPGKFKRAELREKPRKNVGDFENPIKQLVRQREKERYFNLLPPPIPPPVVKPPPSKLLKKVDGVPNVSPSALQRRLEFLLSDEAIQQQLQAKLRPGLTPYQAELFMWERQMTDLRKIYRAQYLQKLSEVVSEEQKLQLAHLEKETAEKEKRHEAMKQRLIEDKKRRALLKDQQRIDNKVTQAVTMAKISRRKMNHILWLSKLERSSEFVASKNTEEIVKERESTLLNRNISIPELLRQLNQNDVVEKSIKKKITGTHNALQSLLEKSFDILPEDAPEFEAEASDDITARQKAVLTYSGFTEEEKLKLLDEKIDHLTQKIEKEELVAGGMKTNLYLQLRDQLDAARKAHYEKDYVGETTKAPFEPNGKKE